MLHNVTVLQRDLLLLDDEERLLLRESERELELERDPLPFLPRDLDRLEEDPLLELLLLLDERLLSLDTLLERDLPRPLFLFFPLLLSPPPFSAFSCWSLEGDFDGGLASDKLGALLGSRSYSARQIVLHIRYINVSARSAWRPGYLEMLFV